MRLVSKIALLATFLLILTGACGGGSSPDSGGDSPKATAVSESSGSGSSGSSETSSGPELSEADTRSFGQAVARTYVCSGCHTVDGVGAAGPTWLGLFGSEETLDDGTVVTVDEAYLRESILDPNAKIVEGFSPNIMPDDFAERLSDSQLDLLNAYINILN